VCLNPCATCSSNNICLTCMFPYSQTPNSNGQCYSCADYRCLSCSFPQVNFCTNCISGFVASTGGTCVSTCPQQ
jgi:hypothetical protein